MPRKVDLPGMDEVLVQMEENVITSDWVVIFSLLQPKAHQTKGLVSVPGSSSEAELLLETARAEWRLRKIQKQCADQLFQWNQLRLEYSRVQVQRAERHVLEAETHIGRARMVIRRYGYPSGFDIMGDDGTCKRCN